jgi:hypothetical protein
MKKNIGLFKKLRTQRGVYIQAPIQWVPEALSSPEANLLERETPLTDTAVLLGAGVAQSV